MLNIFKKHTRLSLVLATAATISFTSCTNDLDQQPLDDDETTADQLFVDGDAYTAAIAGVYGNLSLTGTDGPESSNLGDIDAGTSQYGRGLMNLQIFTTDEIVWTYINDEGGSLHNLQTSSWNASNSILRGMYSRVMFSVALSNEFLRQSTEARLDQRGISGDIRNQMPAYRAEARLLRAMAYYHMMDLFGKAAMYTQEDPVGNFAGPEVDRTELFNFIESELTTIENDLVDARQNEYGRADKAVAWMLLAKMYLNSEVYLGAGQVRYTEAIENLNKIINAGYALSPNYIDLFRGDNDSNAARNEIIFPIVTDGQFVRNFGPTTVMTNGAVGSIEQNGTNLGVTAGGWGGAIRLTPQFASKFEGASFANDTRNTIITDGREAEINEVTDPSQGYILEKYTNVKSDGSQGSDLTFSDVDFPMFRLGDVYLMYAEATLRGGAGDRALALNYINELRSRANATSITDAELTLDFIIDERARELYWEGHRRQDLVRFGLFTGGAYNWALKGNSSTGISTPSHLNVFAIPQASRDANRNLSQNDGY